MTLTSKLTALAVVAILAAQVLPACGRAGARGRARLEAARAWHQARLELQLITMDFPEAEAPLGQAMEILNGNGVPR